MRRVRPIGVAAASTMLLLLTACGGDTDDSDGGADQSAEEATVTEDAVETDAAPEEAVEEAETPPGASAEQGIVIVDGTEYSITELRNCEPLVDGVFERELELQGLGEADGERVQIDVYLQQANGVDLHEVSWSGPEGVFGGPENPNITLDAAGTSVRGVATLVDGMTQTETVQVDFDLAVPAETIACR